MRMIKDIIIILYLIVVPMWIIELLGIDDYLYSKYISVKEKVRKYEV